MYTKIKGRLLIGLGISVVLSVLFYAGYTSYQEASEQAVKKITSTEQKRIIYMSAVEYKGGTITDKEPYPRATLPSGGGYKLMAPDKNSRWEVETYRWDPGTIVAYEGEEIELHILGIHSAKHHGKIEGYDVDFLVERGKLTVVPLKTDQTGIFNIVCHDHLPTMQTQLVVLPKKS